MVTALFKKLNRQLKENYQPISLLSCISKIFEKNDSAVLRLLSLCDAIYNGLDNSYEMLLLFLDISKAFDKVWHPGLLFKLRQSGIYGAL
jgi:hypothetical protein